jgi:hypothetical protein
MRAPRRMGTARTLLAAALLGISPTAFASDPGPLTDFFFGALAAGLLISAGLASLHRFVGLALCLLWIVPLAFVVPASIDEFPDVVVVILIFWIGIVALYMNALWQFFKHAAGEEPTSR